STFMKTQPAEAQTALEYTADVTAQRVARVYAEGLLQAAEKREAAEPVLEELESLVQDVFKQQPLFEQFLTSFAIDRKNKTVVLDLLGGMTVRVGDWLYDASVRTQLETIRNQLITRSSHEIQSGRDRFSSPGGD